jgi:uncharacterized damage-inducible protein DinB
VGRPGKLMTIEDIRTLLDYHYWARDRLLAALDPLTDEQFTRDMGSSFKSIHDTIVHVFAAEWAWHSRWNGVSPTALSQAGELADIATLRARWTELEQQVRGYVDAAGEEGLSRVYDYKLLSGVASRSPLWQMVHHVVNHASYHRGQVTTMLRQIGAPPAKSLDLIAFYRERA